ncbi:hypothetical protein CC1G_00111 [Coprinopsis cinerea okayama7|uniref:Uncharacterized protein n=1 Tax=Coprinopsis cinerea (strain Okayama-7 / 130 / ATCC MYA-4618 / FGSC 9003) TaxID=240176 RepID=A8NWS7_COPC7|nr:hypothetical protein CC1G_00111 [Coprinopsis cinerea okayama7\|eukprot:XP_001836975.2 hypothetical protein CC1G_00111 [Coprinopsis cinerea okayama7\
MLRTSQGQEEQEEAEPIWTNPKICRTFPPGLIVLHEPSLYFADAEDELLPSVVLFDSQLLNLQLPITKAPSDTYQYLPRRDRQFEPVFGLVEKFFEWVALFELAEDEDTIPSSQGEDDEVEALHQPGKQMKLYRVKSPKEVQLFRWEEVISSSAEDAVPVTRFVF